MSRHLPAALVTAAALAACPAARAHFPHDPIAEVALWGEGSGAHIVAQYLYPKRRLIVVSDDGGDSFGYVAPPSVDDVLEDLRFADETTLVAADGVSSAVLISDDGGWTWGATAEPDGSAVWSVAPSPAFAEDATLVAGTAEGLWRSADRGATWEPVPAYPGDAVRGVLLSPAWPGDPFIAAWTRGGALWLTRDGGASWTRAAVGVDAVITTATLSPGLTDDGRLWAGAEDGRIWRSDDRGETFVEVSPRPGGEDLAEPIADLTALAAGRQLAVSPTHAVLCSDDGGEDWATCDEGIPAQTSQSSSDWGHYRRLDAGPERGARVALGAWQGLVLSDDGGESWSKRCAVLPTYERALAIGPAYPDDPRIYVGAYGAGLYVSEDGGASWTVIADRQQHLYMEQVVPSPGFPDDPVLMLVSSRRLIRSEDGGETWASVDIPEMYALHEVVPAPTFTADGVVLASGTTRDEGQRVIARSADRGRTWEVAWMGDPPPAAQVMAPVFSPNYETTGAVYAGQSFPPGALRSDDGGASWTVLHELSADQEVAALFAVDDGGSDLLVLVTALGQVWRGGADGAGWELVTDLGTAVVGGVALGAGETPALVLRTDPSGLWRSLDGGATWRELPTSFSSPVLGLAAPPRYPDDPTLMASTHYGTFVTCDDGASWSLVDRLLRLEQDSCALRYEGDGWSVVEGEGTGEAVAVSATPGDAVEVRVRGSAVRWLAARWPEAGVAVVSLDGEELAQVDLAADTPVITQVVFEGELGDDLTHTFRVEVLDGEVQVDAVEILRDRVENGPAEVYEVAGWCVDLPPDGAPPRGCCPAEDDGDAGGGGVVILLAVLVSLRRRDAEAATRPPRRPPRGAPGGST